MAVKYRLHNQVTSVIAQANGIAGPRLRGTGAYALIATGDG